MVAYNFTVFTDKVANRTKRQTVRRSARCKPGDRLQLYTNMRHKTCRKLVDEDPVCTKIQHVKMSSYGLFIDGVPVSDERAHAFALADGFANYAEMASWFLKTYAKELSNFGSWTGVVVQWDWPEALEVAA